MNLLTRKQQIQLARQGAELLKNKRDALLKDFFELVKPLVASRRELTEKLERAHWHLFLALAYDGEEKVASTALASQDGFGVELTVRNVWGIRIPDVKRARPKRTPFERGYAPSDTSGRIDEAGRRFEELVDAIVALAPLEMKVKKLGEEIKKTSRRVNALEQQLIPRLNQEKRYIQQVLEERSREDTFRLKRIKQKA